MLDDLEVLDSPHESDQSIIDENIRDFKVDRDNYFYLPGKILHIDGDKDYLDR